MISTLFLVVLRLIFDYSSINDLDSLEGSQAINNWHFFVRSDLTFYDPLNPLRQGHVLSNLVPSDQFTSRQATLRHHFKDPLRLGKRGIPCDSEAALIYEEENWSNQYIRQLPNPNPNPRICDWLQKNLQVELARAMTQIRPKHVLPCETCHETLDIHNIKCLNCLGADDEISPAILNPRECYRRFLILSLEMDDLFYSFVLRRDTEARLKILENMAELDLLYAHYLTSRTHRLLEDTEHSFVVRIRAMQKVFKYIERQHVEKLHFTTPIHEPRNYWMTLLNDIPNTIPHVVFSYYGKVNGTQAIIFLPLEKQMMHFFKLNYKRLYPRSAERATGLARSFYWLNCRTIGNKDWDKLITCGYHFVACPASINPCFRVVIAQDLVLQGLHRHKWDLPYSICTKDILNWIFLTVPVTPFQTYIRRNTSIRSYKKMRTERESEKKKKLQKKDKEKSEEKVNKKDEKKSSPTDKEMERFRSRELHEMMAPAFHAILTFSGKPLTGTSRMNAIIQRASMDVFPKKDKQSYINTNLRTFAINPICMDGFVPYRLPSSENLYHDECGHYHDPLRKALYLFPHVIFKVFIINKNIKTMNRARKVMYEAIRIEVAATTGQNMDDLYSGPIESIPSRLFFELPTMQLRTRKLRL